MVKRVHRGPFLLGHTEFGSTKTLAKGHRNQVRVCTISPAAQIKAIIICATANRKAKDFTSHPSGPEVTSDAEVTCAPKGPALAKALGQALQAKGARSHADSQEQPTMQWPEVSSMVDRQNKGLTKRKQTAQ